MYSFIVNPNSRSGEGRNVWNRLRSIMESQGISYQYFLTEYVGHATVLAKKISAAGTPESLPELWEVRVISPVCREVKASCNAKVSKDSI